VTSYPSDYSWLSIVTQSQGCLDCQVDGFKHEVVSYIDHLELYVREC
jgi:hypothetical protein